MRNSKTDTDMPCHVNVARLWLDDFYKKESPKNIFHFFLKKQVNESNKSSSEACSECAFKYDR